MIEKIFFSKTKDEIDYSKCYKTISYNVILDYIYLPIIRIRITIPGTGTQRLKFPLKSEIGECSFDYCTHVYTVAQSPHHFMWP